MTRSRVAPRACVAAFLTALLVAERASAEDAAPAEEARAEQSLAEINKQLTNPVSSIWSITFQQNNFRVDPGPG